MPLAPGARLGPYEIVAPLGAGGMGEVYRARDTRLGREVAIKILGSRLAVTPERRERFLQEARAASALNHPNIVSLYDISSEEGSDFLVMELVRGQTLEQLIGRRGLTVNEAVKYAIPIAEAVARAHAAGILHRDLKPSNIMVTESGAPKILDFGLAQLIEPAPDSEDDETRTLVGGAPRSEDGGIAGTPAYMSPEQAEGKKADARSDIFSFGAVLYEMITGRRAFRGDSTVSTLAAVLHEEPESASRLTPQTPRDLERIIQRCLRKVPNRRFQSMSDIKVELEEVREESESGAQAAPSQLPAPRRGRGRRYALVAALAMLAMVAAFFWLHNKATLSSAGEPTPLTAYRGEERWPDFSPDGAQVVFSWSGWPQGNFHLYVKITGSPNHLQLTSSEGSDQHPAWSPDGRWIAFQRYDHAGSVTTLLISPIGGPERKVGDGLCSGQLTWSHDSQWIACESARPEQPGLILASAAGGEMRQLTSPSKGQSDGYPAFSPDGRSLLYSHCDSPADCDLALLELDERLAPRGLPRRVTNEHAGAVGGLCWMASGREAIWSLSKTAMFAETLYRVPVFNAGPPERLAFSGRALDPAVAPHGNRLAYTRIADDIHIWRTDGHTAERHPVSSTRTEYNPQFSPDGKRIVFESNRSGPEEIWVANADGTGLAQLTTIGRHSGSPHWSPNGQWIVFDSRAAGGRWDVWAIDSAGGTPRQLTRGPGDANVPRFSYDGKLVYFHSSRTGRLEVFRVPFPEGQAVQVTHNGGAFPQESQDGKTLYFAKPDSGVWQMATDGGEEHSTGMDVLAGELVSNGAYFITSEPKNGAYELRYRDSATGAQRLVQTLAEGQEPQFGIAVSLNEKTFLYALREVTGSNVMLVENFR